MDANWFPKDLWIRCRTARWEGNGASSVLLTFSFSSRSCQKHYANYTCPRCNLHYCSLQCYKCTEAFSRDNVLAEMKNVEVSKETKQKILQALQRQSEEGKESINDEEEETFISDETLHKLIAGAEVTVADLSLDELKAFQRAVASG
ncbi:zinc finger HIT domain-containing protein 2 [Selaginella moellendorffii]|uniref:zinc finger HIT domain-containing protein 2 n=1 Tax=Selaginella moellendorffii TaxID=88036 RepID=UPI000D1C6D0B|nr:zinc finger HIT domain-containing protein 2 [Selaginella moellendorffii]|eukprot:XP_024519211.1 zinc finger HIT domain-containing protein 2 [Selaginella moellendorffii]